MDRSDLVILPEGDRAVRLVEAVGGLVVCSGMAWLLLDGWLVIAASILAAVGFLLYALRAPRTVQLTDEALVERRRGHTVTLPLDTVNRIKLEWVPYRAPELTVETRSGAYVAFAFNDDAKTFVLALGERLVGRRRAIHAKPSAVKALGWPEANWQMD